MFHLTLDQVFHQHLSLKASTSCATCIKELSGIDSTRAEIRHQQSPQSCKETLLPQTYSQAPLLAPPQPSVCPKSFLLIARLKLNHENNPRRQFCTTADWILILFANLKWCFKVFKIIQKKTTGFFVNYSGLMALPNHVWEHPAFRREERHYLPRAK